MNFNSESKREKYVEIPPPFFGICEYHSIMNVFIVGRLQMDDAKTESLEFRFQLAASRNFEGWQKENGESQTEKKKAIIRTNKVLKGPTHLFYSQIPELNWILYFWNEWFHLRTL